MPSKIIRHSSGATEAQKFYVASKWHINHIDFPQGQTEWLFRDIGVKKYHYLVNTYFQIDSKLWSDYQQYSSKLSELHLMKNKSTMVLLMIRGMILYLRNPQHYGHSPLLVVNSLLNDWKVTLYRSCGRMVKYRSESFKCPQGSTALIMKNGQNYLMYPIPHNGITLICHSHIARPNTCPNV